MKFNKQHKAKLSSMNRAEASVYVAFLGEEIDRHIAATQKAQLDVGGFLAYIDLLLSAITRHMEDIEDAQALIQKVKKEFKL